MSLQEFENFLCPYCSQSNEVSIDLTGERYQEFVVDCEVCCAPITIRLKISNGEVEWLDVQKENE